MTTAHPPSSSYFLTSVRISILIWGDLPVCSHKQFLAMGLFKPLPPPDKPSSVFSPDHPTSGRRPSHKQLHVFQVFKPLSPPANLLLYFPHRQRDPTTDHHTTDFVSLTEVRKPAWVVCLRPRRPCLLGRLSLCSSSVSPFGSLPVLGIPSSPSSIFYLKLLTKF